MTTTHDDRSFLRAQAASGLVFSIFLATHLVNTAIGALGPASYDGAQAVLRRGYQAPVIELVAVLGALLVHMGFGVVAMARRGRTVFRAPPSPLLTWHRISGWFLLTFALGHVTATRGSSWIAGVAPGFAGVAWTFEWVPAYFIPYYLGLGLAGVVHGCVGVLLASARLGFPIGAAGGRRLRSGAAVLGGLVVLGLSVIGGVFGKRVEHPAESEYARWVLRLLENPTVAVSEAWRTTRGRGAGE